MWRTELRPLDLISTARHLAKLGGTRRPRQSDLKRAVSTAYYALFHAMCQNCADSFIGGTNADRSASAWRQVYRSVDHGHAKSQCKNKDMLEKFPKDIEDFAEQFYKLQIERHAADYDPNSKFFRTDVQATIDAAEVAMKAFAKVPIKHRRAFAAWVSLRDR